MMLAISGLAKETVVREKRASRVAFMAIEENRVGTMGEWLRVLAS
jgi:hypothetical protein